MAIKPNVLNQFVSYNYIWSLDVASNDEVRTGAYRESKGSILRSGGSQNKLITTASEDVIGANVEYFIDNVNVEYLVSPNPLTGVTNSTKIDFTVTEPYSIGLFLQTLYLAALNKGHTTYINAPYVLTCQFVGYTPDGKIQTVEKRTLLVTILNVTFTANQGGSVYSVEAISYSQQALLDEVQRVKTSVKISGTKVIEVLSTGENSLISKLIKQEQEYVEKELKNSPDEYEIIFPDDISRPEGAVNIFGQSDIVNDLRSLGNLDTIVDAGAWDESTGTLIRDVVTIGKDKTFQFKEDVKIEKIIEEVILTSTWGESLLSQKPDSSGYYKWFKIFTKTTPLGSSASADVKPPRKFTYMVYPYKVHASTFSTRTEKIDYTYNVSNAPKAYHYIYTGKNTDVLDFEVKVDYAFFQPIPADNAQGDLTSKDQASLTCTVPVEHVAAKRKPQSASDLGLELPLPQQIVNTSLTSSYGGSLIDSSKIRVAKLFNDAIMNSNADMVLVNMTIWGDPFYMSDSDFGGYTAGSLSQNIEKDGTIDYLRSEVDVLIKFSNPVDYKRDLLTPDPTNIFNGVYKVVIVRAMFSNGEFKQELELVRRPVQTEQTINYANAVALGQEAGYPVNGYASGQQIDTFMQAASASQAMYSVFQNIGTSVLNTFGFDDSAISNFISDIENTFASAQQFASSISTLSSTVGGLTNVNMDIDGLRNFDLLGLTQKLNSINDFFNSVFATTGLSQTIAGITQVQNSINQLKTGITSPAGIISTVPSIVLAANTANSITTFLQQSSKTVATTPTISTTQSLQQGIRNTGSMRF